ncbi:MAG: hypothetical protein OEL83_03995 [Desulforhopalus sp.]|nr:hypothetical protein [Desulforhopalus sp.]
MRFLLPVFIGVWLIWNCFAGGAAADTSPVVRPGHGEIVDPRDPSKLQVKPPQTNFEICLLGPRPNANGATDLEQRLTGCKPLRRNIIWQKGDGSPEPFDEWPATRKQQLNNLFQRLIQSNGTGPWPNQALNFCKYADTMFTLVDGNRQVYFSSQRALTTYLAHVAHALYLEASDALPWKLFARPDEEIQEILSSERYFAPIKPLPEGNVLPSGIKAGRDYQLLNEYRRSLAALCDPRVGNTFARGQNLIGNGERDTLVKLTAWLQDYAYHGPPLQSYQSSIYLIGRLIKKTSESGVYGYMMVGGCHGAAAMLKDLARSVNIPLRYVATREIPYNTISWSSGTHSGLAWHWQGTDGLYCWHTDDIYANDYFSNAFSCSPGASGPAPITEAERNEIIFRNTWFSRKDLESYGFEFNMHKVLPGIGYDAADDLSDRYMKQYPDHGFALGQWRPTVLLKNQVDSKGLAGTEDIYSYSRDDGTVQNVPMYQLVSSYFLKMKQRYATVGGGRLDTYTITLHTGHDSPIYKDFEFSELYRIYGMNPPVKYWEDPWYWKGQVMKEFNDTLTCYGGLPAVHALQDEWQSRRMPAK